MNKYFFAILLVAICFLNPVNVVAWSDNDTHPLITKFAARQSFLKTGTYLNDYLGFKDGYGEIISSGKNIETLLMNGARTEDTGILMPGRLSSCSRGLNHFYNPITKTGLDDTSYVFGPGSLFPIDWEWHWTGIANPVWAQWNIYCNNSDGSSSGRVEDFSAVCFYMKYSDPEPTEAEQKSNMCNEFSWYYARMAFIIALTSHDNDERNKFFARTFRSVGQVTHLLEDMSVPAHVRNDMQGHLYFQQIAFNLPSNWYGNNLEAYVQKRPQLVSGGGSPLHFNKLLDYWDTNAYSSYTDINNSIGGGLAEYTNANFLSEFRLLGATGYPHPAANDGVWEVANYTDEDYYDNEFKNIYRVYFEKKQGEKVTHLIAKGYFSDDVEDDDIKDLTYALDERCFADYAAKLIPKAIDYSAGIMDYFFRGTLAIEKPDRYVYSIADGSKLRGFVVNGEVVQQQYFDYIKAKVRNSTDYNGGGDAPMGPGKLWAVAKYKMRTNYDPELAKDPPIAAEREENFSYSISAPKDGINMGLDWQEFEFDFSDDPIPAGITDLYLQVVYQGTLGNEKDTAVAVGMKDISEPTHFVAMNATDRVYVNYILRTTQEIIDNATARSFYFDNCSDPEDYHDCTPCMYPFDVKIRIAFGRVPGGQDADYDVVVNSQPAGSYSRIIFLTDEASFTATITRDATDSFPCMYPDLSQLPLTTYSNPMPSAVNQEDSSGVFHNTPLNPIYGDFRQIYNHGLTAFLVATPLDISLYGLETMDWPQLNGSTPIPITINR